MPHVWSFFGAGAAVGALSMALVVVVSNLLEERRMRRLARAHAAAQTQDGRPS